MRDRLRLVAVALAACAAAWPGWQQAMALRAQQAAPPPTFTTEVEYVEVDALVTDGQGTVVRDLGRDDFQIFEDGRPQKIASFTSVDIPVEPPAPPSAAFRPEPDVQTSERPFTGRVYVLLFDDLHTAPERSPLVKRAARRFIEEYLGADDLMAVVYTDRRPGAAQDFTSSKRLLLAAVDRFTGQKIESATLARNTEAFRNQTERRTADPFEMERAFNARAALRVVRDVADWLGGVRGRRKTVILVSEGIDYDISDVFDNRSATSIIGDTRDAIAAATRANVSIYALDSRSLTAVSGDAVEVGMFADQQPAQRTGDDGALERAPGINAQGLENELRLARDSLRTLADGTGGFAAVNASGASDAFGRIVRDNSAYYVLAYYPASSRRDGRFHAIEVRTSRPGLEVRARRGYLAPRRRAAAPRAASNDGASRPVVEALNSPLPASGMGLRVFAAPFAGAGSAASVVFGVELRGRDLPVASGRAVELSYLAVDGSGRIQAGDTDQFALTLAADARASVERRGLRILNRLALPPGRYQFRVAARNSETGALGALSYDVEVPDLTRRPLEMSGVVLASGAAGETMTARGDVPLQQVMPVPPTAERAFAQADDILVFAEIYERSAGAPHVVEIATRVAAADGTVAFQARDERTAPDLAKPARGYRHLVRVPMDGLRPGPYVLTVEARARGGEAVSRSVPFDVVP